MSVPLSNSPQTAQLTLVVYSTTKIATGANDMRNNVVNQLRKLQIDQADLFLLHWPYDFDKPGMPTLEEAWLELEKIKRAGLTRLDSLCSREIAIVSRC